MKQFYELKIKPLNDRLGNDLGKKTVLVQHIEKEHEVRVDVTFKSRNGNIIRMTNTQIRDCRALGLMI